MSLTNCARRTLPPEGLPFLLALSPLLPFASTPIPVKTQKRQILGSELRIHNTSTSTFFLIRFRFRQGVGRAMRLEVRPTWDSDF